MCHQSSWSSWTWRWHGWLVGCVWFSNKCPSPTMRWELRGRKFMLELNLQTMCKILSCDDDNEEDLMVRFKIAGTRYNEVSMMFELKGKLANGKFPINFNCYSSRFFKTKTVLTVLIVNEAMKLSCNCKKIILFSRCLISDSWTYHLPTMEG